MPCPDTSFPTDFEYSQQELDEELVTLLINSDSQECNENLSSYIKHIVDHVCIGDDSDLESGESQKTYHKLSVYALKLLTSNLFVKNYQFCLGKILAFLSTFTMLTESRLENNEAELDSPSVDKKIKYEAECLKEFLCIILLLLLKLKNTSSDNGAMFSEPNYDPEIRALDSIQVKELSKTLQDIHFIEVISNFISTHVISTAQQETSFVLLKFGCDIFFEYLYFSELLTDEEFSCLTNNTQLIQTLIKYLLSNENFNNYDIDGDDFEDEDKLIAYEEFKLLLLINEQYLMKSYSCGDIRNKVFNGLMNGDNSSSNTNIPGFINLLIYHINREESQIIKILILKFLYLVFTTSFTTKLVYLNDLKILVDIFIRELNDMDYSGDVGNENRFLMITYLKVMYPLLRFSQLRDESEIYKSDQILDLLQNLILNSTSNSTGSIGELQREQEDVIAKLAKKCMEISWLKNRRSKPTNPVESGILKPEVAPENESTSDNLSASSSSSSLTNVENTRDPSDLTEQSNTSNDSIGTSMTRVASVRTSSRSDYHKHTTSHNLQEYRRSSGTYTKRAVQNASNNVFQQNNNNVFLSKSMNKMTIADTSDSLKYSPWADHHSLNTTQKECIHEPSSSNILDLPNEYLHSKPLPKVPVPARSKHNGLYRHDGSSSSSINSGSSLVRKALKKKAPPPPSHPPIPTSPPSLEDSFSRSPTPKFGTPPPPPPRRRRHRV
ncbi:uncharacterized protein RJT20DRAFT_146878 [Scheffersomyces xylosifermentans]|uniref:uncharacterized protein n=1 Tax=Scheffersomyces xylosifermentans TaxID=1304137 RepID=UPI00315D0438